MSLPRRTIYDAASLSHPQLYEDAPTDQAILFGCNMSRVLGAFHQLIYLNAYAAEAFDNIMQLSEDVNSRIKTISHRSTLLFNKLEAMETRVFTNEIQATGHSGKLAKEKFLQDRESYTPTVISRNTNCGQILSLYDSCTAIPQFYKLSQITGQDVAEFYSNPGK